MGVWGNTLFLSFHFWSAQWHFSSFSPCVLCSNPVTVQLSCQNNDWYCLTSQSVTSLCLETARVGSKKAIRAVRKETSTIERTEQTTGRSAKSIWKIRIRVGGWELVWFYKARNLQPASCLMLPLDCSKLNYSFQPISELQGKKEHLLDSACLQVPSSH